MTSRAFARDQPQWMRATTKKRIVVMTMVVVTAMP